MTNVTIRRFRMASPAAALVLGGVVLALMIAAVPLAGLAHQGLDASRGSVPVWQRMARRVPGRGAVHRDEQAQAQGALLYGGTLRFATH